MSLLLVTALALTGSVQASCSWDRPGANPFMGDVVTAVDRYADIPADVRARLKQRIAARKFDELATIKRDTIAGAFTYTDLRDMHFGKGTICQTVTRSKWSDTTQERGLVYCEAEHCLIVPTVCRNVSRVTRLPNKQARTEVPSLPPAQPAPPQTAEAGGEPGELSFDMPSAGAGPSFSTGLTTPTSSLPADADGERSFASALPAGPSARSLWHGFDLAVPAVPPPVFALSTFTGPPVLGDVPPANPPLFGIPGIPGIPGSSAPALVPAVPAADPPDPGTVVPFTTPVPEPSTYALMALGLALVLWQTRKRQA